MLNVKKFLKLFDEFYSNESEIYDAIEIMTLNDLDAIKSECDKHLEKYYGVWDTTINIWYSIH